MDSENNPGTSDILVSAAGGLHRIVTTPLVGKVDSVHLFLVIGVVLVAAMIWTRVLAHMKV